MYMLLHVRLPTALTLSIFSAVPRRCRSIIVHRPKERNVRRVVRDREVMMKWAYFALTEIDFPGRGNYAIP